MAKLNDTDRFPLFYFDVIRKTVKPFSKEMVLPDYGFKWQFHHFVEKKKLRKYPKLIEHQKLILMPSDMNYDIDRRTAGFKDRWGVEINEVVYGN